MIIDENSPITQVDPYGLLKLAIEYCCSTLYNNGLIQEYIILRLPAVLAPKSINFVTTLAYTLYNKKEVTLSGDSSYYNACIDVISLARIVDTIVKERIYTCGPVNIGSINSMKISDLVDFLQLELGVNVPVMWSKKGSWVGSNSPYTLDLTVASRCCLPLPTLESSLSNLCLLIEKEYFNTV